MMFNFYHYKSVDFADSLTLFCLHAAIFARILYLIAPSKLSSYPSSRPSIPLSSKTMKMAKEYYAGSVKDFSIKSGNISSTLEKLYAWEKKLYQEVKVMRNQSVEILDFFYLLSLCIFNIC